MSRWIVLLLWLLGCGGDAFTAGSQPDAQPVETGSLTQDAGLDARVILAAHVDDAGVSEVSNDTGSLDSGVSDAREASVPEASAPEASTPQCCVINQNYGGCEVFFNLSYSCSTSAHCWDGGCIEGSCSGFVGACK